MKICSLVSLTPRQMCVLSIISVMAYMILWHVTQSHSTWSDCWPLSRIELGSGLLNHMDGGMSVPAISWRF